MPSYSEAQKTKRPVVNGTAKQCQCGARKVNGVSNGVELRGSRVGSQYLQAVARARRDSSADRPHPSRSRSIENFSNSCQLYPTEPALVTHVIDEHSPIKHHTSYGDLYNGRIGSKESVNGNRHSPGLNGQSTDTDYSSDGGYKSLPSSINCQSPKKVSGIPRRSFDQKFSTKHVKASAV